MHKAVYPAALAQQMASQAGPAHLEHLSTLGGKARLQRLPCRVGTTKLIRAMPGVNIQGLPAHSPSQPGT